MSWATERTNLNTIIVTTNGYKELPQLIDNESGEQIRYSNKSFYMQPVGIDLSDFSDNSIAGTHEVELKLFYLNLDTTQRDANFQLFLDLIKAISAVTSFNGYSENGSFIDSDNQNTIGILRFFIGVESC